jgi:hypothetical protein
MLLRNKTCNTLECYTTCQAASWAARTVCRSTSAPEHPSPSQTDDSGSEHFGPEARRHGLVLSETQVITLLHEREQPLDLEMQPGYVILRHAGRILGCGLYAPGCLRSQLPQHPDPVASF